ncbi:MAG: MFS transporter, partial [Thaumarchaeota archaeon]|nr:MFS transporter [Nitrososphaerota archaeon]
MAAPVAQRGRNNLRALVTILCTYGVVTISQVNIASIYLPVSITFNEQIVGLGVLTSAFFIGYGVVELPGGVAGARFGAKTLANLGLFITLLSLIACAFAPSFEWLIALRFAVGVGFGLFFPSGLVLAIRQIAEASSGLAAGSTTAAFSIGGAAGVFGWSVLSAVYGWRASLLIQAAIVLAAVVAFVLWVPSDRSSSAPSLSSSAFRRALTNRKLLVVSALLFGSGATSILSGNFLVYYLEKSFGVQPGYAGFIAALSYAVVLVTALVGGRAFDKGGNPKLIVLISVLVLAFGTAIIAVHSVLLVLVGSLLCGLAIGPISVVAIVTARRTAS